MEPKVINNIYDTRKTHLQIFEDKVVKRFKNVSGQLSRYLSEKNALQRMAHLSTTPNLITHDDNKRVFEISKLPGKTVSTLSSIQLKNLAIIVEQMLQSGVARHSLPIRDILVDGNKVNLVDFERVTLRKYRWAPSWLIAIKVTHYHLYRLANTYHPELLTPSQKKKLNIVQSIRAFFKH